jgi:hypothetical protein
MYSSITDEFDKRLVGEYGALLGGGLLSVYPALFVRVSTQDLLGSRCGRNGPLGWEAENAERSQRGRRLPPVKSGLWSD